MHGHNFDHSHVSIRASSTMSGRRRRTRLGQHLLRDERVLERIVDAVPLDPLPILEVGTGDGALTARLAELDRPLVSMELDESMAFRARRKLASDGLDRSAVVVEETSWKPIPKKPWPWSLRNRRTDWSATCPTRSPR